MLAYHGTWAFQRLIYAGEYLDGDDLPPGMLKEHEKEELAGNFHHPYYGDYPVSRVYDVATRLTKYVDFNESLWPDQFGSLRLRNFLRGWYDDDPSEPLSAGELRELDKMIAPDYSWDGKPETEWVLCNWKQLLYDGPVNRGRWADTLRYHDHGSIEGTPCFEGKDLVDVSQTVVGDVLNIWRAERPEELAPKFRPRKQRNSSPPAW
ncbi:uncharacterized protein B0H18DRAFT_952825 [Fomitopsis serialis]|uniref:uncharacterized protein n=1 Tax=Fomitopsis serialis TaxID=139415 RepID=UPI00200768B6|nr:uncharacterized protein B0H18DRAFT_952825 [Neoantrodia serialis]KAH9931320.1 hypothetical protein B0H18DRAFT_952825 [Neoantrodia serialis]